MLARNTPTEATKRYFDQWHLYRQIIDNDYMAHHGIHSAIGEYLTAHVSSPYTLVDLGCGDASQIAKTLKRHPPDEYVGIDLSPVALDQARTNISAQGIISRFVEEDLSTYLERDSSAATRFLGLVDVIVAGFTVHHLHTEAKRIFFQRCVASLHKGGHLLFYDVFRRPGEHREQYLSAYLANMEHHWVKISRESMTAAREHATACDYPEEPDTITTMAQNSGFSPDHGLLFSDALRFHCLYAFRAPR